MVLTAFVVVVTVITVPPASAAGSGASIPGFEAWFYYVGGMVNSYSGNLIVRVTDFTVKARGTNIEFTRTYNSQRSDIDGPLGYGWTSNYHSKVTENANGSVTWTDPDGSQHLFTKSGSNYNAPSGISSKLSKSGALFKLKHTDGSVWDFNNKNNLDKITDKNSNKITLSWSGGATPKLQSVSDDSGVSVSFTHTGSLLTDATFSYLTCTSFCFLEDRTYSYSYTSDEMRSTTDGLGSVSKYTYAAPVMGSLFHVMKSKRDPVGKRQDINYTAALDNGVWKVIDIRDLSVNLTTNNAVYGFKSFSLGYNSSWTTVTNARGKTTYINHNSPGSPLTITGPQCGECGAFQLMGGGNGKGGGGCGCSSGGCGSSGLGGFREISQALTMTWSSNRDLLTYKDAGNHQYVMTWDSKRNILTQKDPMLNTTKWSWTNYDNASAYLSLLDNTTNRRNFKTTFVYDANGRLNKTTDALGNYTQRGYNSNGYMTYLRDFRGKVTTFTYSTKGYLLTIKDATGNTTTLQNDGIGRVLNESKPDGHTWKFQWDANDQRTKVTDPRNNATTTTYDKRNQVTKITAPLGRITEFTWNVTAVKVSSVKDALGNTTTYAYDLTLNLATQTNRRGYATTFTYDDYNRMTKVKDAKNNETVIAYNADGTTKNITDRRGYKTHFTYNANHRALTTTDAMGNVATYTYDENENVKTYTNGRSFSWTNTYDALDRVTQVNDPLGNFSKREYDANGNLLKTTDENANTITHTYDNINRLATVTNGISKVTTYTYDSESNLLTVKDANLKTTTLAYDSLNRRTQVKDANLDTTNFTYDALGNLLNTTDDNGRVVKNEYDKLNRITKETSPLSKVTLYTWDADGNMATRKDPLLRTTTYTHDELNRLTKIAYPNSTNLTATYDAEGNTLTAVGFGYTRTQVWDALRRVTSITFNYGSFSKQVQYTYDQVGNKKTILYPEGQYVNTTYDALNRPTTIADSILGSWTLAYDKASRRTQIVHPTGVKTQYTYNKADWLLGIYTNKSGGQQLESFVYTYDDVGNRLTITELGGSVTTFGYESVYRLKDSSYPASLTINYTYDGKGNRLTEKRNGVTTTYTYDNDDRMTARGSTTYGWDDNGNMVNETTSGATTTYEYDYESRLTKITVAGNNVVQFTYGVQNNRMSRTYSSATTYYLFDFYDRQHLDDLIGEYNASGGLQVRYVHGPGADETLARAGSVTRYYNAEAQSSTTSLSNSSQSLTSTYRYEAFGNIRSQSGSDTSDQLFNGRIRDSTYSDLYLFRSRWYRPVSGRFTVDEPWRVINDRNRYAFVDNRAPTFVDPTGLDARGGARSLGSIEPCRPVPCINGPIDYPPPPPPPPPDPRYSIMFSPPCIPGLLCPGCLNDIGQFAFHELGAPNDLFIHCWVSCSLVSRCLLGPGDALLLGVLVEIFGNHDPRDLFADEMGIIGGTQTISLVFPFFCFTWCAGIFGPPWVQPPPVPGLPRGPGGRE